MCRLDSFHSRRRGRRRGRIRYLRSKRFDRGKRRLAALLNVGNLRLQRSILFLQRLDLPGLRRLRLPKLARLLLRSIRAAGNDGTRQGKTCERLHRVAPF